MPAEDPTVQKVRWRVENLVLATPTLVMSGLYERTTTGNKHAEVGYYPNGRRKPLLQDGGPTRDEIGMRIGILTFHRGLNHGGYLQAYCLAKAVGSLGHQTEIINYKNRRHWNSERFKPWVYRRPGRLWHDFRKHQAFHRALSEMPLSPFTTDPACVDWNAYDAIIVGSDIVWNCRDERLGSDPVYFGRFPVPYRGRLVAYAPSIGIMNWNAAVPAWASEGLRQFRFIGPRDVSTQRFVQRYTGIEPPVVADPTWLTSENGAAVGRYPRRTNKKYLLVYCFPLEGAFARAVQNFARERGLLCVAAGYWQRCCDVNWQGVDPFEWIQLFSQAEYVVTGTFHGTMYCLRERARFCTLAAPAIESKVATPLALAGLEDRYTPKANEVRDILLKPIDFATVERKRDAVVRESLDLLQQALTE